MDYDPFQPGAKVRIRSTNQWGWLASKGETGYLVRLSQKPDDPNAPVVKVALDDLETQMPPGAGLGLDTSGGLDR